MTRLLVALLAFALATPAFAAETGGRTTTSSRATKRKKTNRGTTRVAPDPNRPVNITSQFFEVLPETHQAQWRGNVVIDRDNVRVTCSTMTATYDDAKRMDKLTCQGNVHMVQRPAKPGDPDREAWGELAVFENSVGVLTVTGGRDEAHGNPSARDGDNEMTGTKVVFFVNENRFQIEHPEMKLKSTGETKDTGPEGRKQ